MKQSSPQPRRPDAQNISSQMHTTEIEKPERIKEIEEYESLC